MEYTKTLLPLPQPIGNLYVTDSLINIRLKRVAISTEKLRAKTSNKDMLA